MGIGYMGYMGFREKLPSCILSIPFSSPVYNWQLGSFRLELEHNFRVLHTVMQPEDQEEVENYMTLPPNHNSVECDLTARPRR